ncbi:MAG: chemotaxis protein CheW [Acidobacteria bacterium]|nr:chemotaxis protein CheW [Acidobacteriota bacterium]
MPAEATTRSVEDLVPSGQLVTFALDGVEFGLDIDRVQEITTRSEITPVPGAPSFVLGVINLRGQIIPVLDSRQRFHLQPAPPSNRTRIIILNLAGEPTGLQVDAVAEVVKLDDFQLRDTPPLVAGIRSEYLAGMVTAGNRLITLIALDRILDSAEFAQREALAKESSRSLEFAHGEVELEGDEEEVDGRGFVTFSLGEESFGIGLAHVEEIVNLPQVTKVPDSPVYVLGVICVRDQVMPLLDLTQILNVKGGGENPKEMVILLSFENARLGIVVDGIQEIIRVREEEILPPPQTLSEPEKQQLEGIVVQSDRMVSLLKVLHILDREDHQKLANLSTSLAVTTQAEQVESHDLPMVVFSLGEESYGLRLQEVREVIMVGQITPVPRAPEFVEGVLNLRGEIMPVLDLRTRFGLQRQARTAQSRILITPIEGVSTGLVVDSVQEVSSVDDRRLEDPPRVTAVGANAYIQKVARTEKGMTFLLDLSNLLNDREGRQLQNFSGRRRSDP